MESNLVKKYIQNIEDFVFIEEKIVTYLWLCQILKIHVNTAKQLLHTFASKDDVKNRLLITYVLGGELKNGKGRLLKLVIQDSKPAVEQLFSKITTDHIFSIQRSGGSFSSTEIFNSFPHFSVLPETRKFCPIRPIKKIEKREINHITESKNFLNPSLPVKKHITPKETESSKKEVNNAENSKPFINETPAICNEPPAKQKKTSGNEKDLKNKGGDIGSFFNRQADKKSSEQPAGGKVKSEKKEEKAKTGIGAFFKPGNKSDISTKEVKEKKEKETTVNSETIENEKEKKDIPEVKKQNGVKEPASAPTKDKKQKSKEGKRKRKKKDDDGMEKKRRKRIVSALSSDSESSGNESSDHEMEVEPEQPPPPSAVEEDEDMIPPTPGRKRVRKQIDKVSMDEDGFIITKKEFVYESCSDDEAKEDKKENKENNVKDDKKVQKSPLNKNEASATNGKQNKSPNNDKSNKQASIMNFFKRKAVT